MNPGERGERWRDWRWQLVNRISRVEHLPLPYEEREALIPVAARYPVSITPYYASLIRWDDPADPIARQCVPSQDEVAFRLPDSTPDPLAEQRYSPLPGLVHRYPDRVLLLASAVCPVLCRHCNRKRTWRMPEALLGSREWRRALDYIRRERGVREVILSGGDPLMLPLSRLSRILEALRAIPHVEVVRIGTRVPVTLPMRVTPELCSVLEGARPLWINTHFNHPREVTREAEEACDSLVTRGIPVSNHTVLLKGVNDDQEVLLTLFRRLQAISVRPYYLFQCDSALGTDHFRVPLPEGISMMEGMWGRTGGLTLPRFVVDLPGGKGKVSAERTHCLSLSGEEALFMNFEGETVRYRW